MCVIVGDSETGYIRLNHVKAVIPGDKLSLLIWEDGSEHTISTSQILAVEA